MEYHNAPSEGEDSEEDEIPSPPPLPKVMRKLSPTAPAEPSIMIKTRKNPSSPESHLMSAPLGSVSSFLPSTDCTELSLTLPAPSHLPVEAVRKQVQVDIHGLKAEQTSASVGSSPRSVIKELKHQALQQLYQAAHLHTALSSQKEGRDSMAEVMSVIDLRLPRRHSDHPVSFTSPTRVKMSEPANGSGSTTRAMT